MITTSPKTDNIVSPMNLISVLEDLITIDSQGIDINNEVSPEPHYHRWFQSNYNKEPFQVDDEYLRWTDLIINDDSALYRCLMYVINYYHIRLADIQNWSNIKCNWLVQRTYVNMDRVDQECLLIISDLDYDTIIKNYGILFTDLDIHINSYRNIISPTAQRNLYKLGFTVQQHVATHKMPQLDYYRDVDIANYFNSLFTPREQWTMDVAWWNDPTSWRQYLVRRTLSLKLNI